jgi:nitronate monooxygenase
MSSATVVEEARWLEARGCDAIIAQGAEAGGHRGMFLDDQIGRQVGLFALLPQVVDAVSVPVIAAGAIADARGVAAAFALGAAGVQVGTAFLKCTEAKLSPVQARALSTAGDASTMITNVFTGRPARGVATRIVREIGPMSPDAPSFPDAALSLAPLRAAAEKLGRDDFSFAWAGQGVALARTRPAADLARALAAGAPV